jgi:MinD-like ATPase involved in chromosome partitioning or flagellar assembly
MSKGIFQTPTYLFGSTRSGTGKATLLAQLAVFFHGKGKRVALVDLNTGFQQQLRQAFPKSVTLETYPDLAEVSQQEGRFRKTFFIKNPERISYFPGFALAPTLLLTDTGIRDFLLQLKGTFDAVLVNLAPGVSSFTLFETFQQKRFYNELRQTVFVVVTLPELRHTLEFDYLLREKPYLPFLLQERLLVVFNKVSANIEDQSIERIQIGTYEIKSVLKIPLSLTIPFLEEIRTPPDASGPAVLSPTSSLRQNISSLARSLTDLQDGALLTDMPTGESLFRAGLDPDFQQRLAPLLYQIRLAVARRLFLPPEKLNVYLEHDGKMLRVRIRLTQQSLRIFPFRLEIGYSSPGPLQGGDPLDDVPYQTTLKPEKASFSPGKHPISLAVQPVYHLDDRFASMVKHDIQPQLAYVYDEFRAFPLPEIRVQSHIPEVPSFPAILGYGRQKLFRYAPKAPTASWFDFYFYFFYIPAQFALASSNTCTFTDSFVFPTPRPAPPKMRSQSLFFSDFSFNFRQYGKPVTKFVLDRAALPFIGRDFQSASAQFRFREPEVGLFPARAFEISLPSAQKPDLPKLSHDFLKIPSVRKPAAKPGLILPSTSSIQFPRFHEIVIPLWKKDRLESPSRWRYPRLLRTTGYLYLAAPPAKMVFSVIKGTQWSCRFPIPGLTPTENPVKTAIFAKSLKKTDQFSPNISTATSSFVDRCPVEPPRRFFLEPALMNHRFDKVLLQRPAHVASLAESPHKRPPGLRVNTTFLRTNFADRLLSPMGSIPRERSSLSLVKLGSVWKPQRIPGSFRKKPDCFSPLPGIKKPLPRFLDRLFPIIEPLPRERPSFSFLKLGSNWELKSNPGLFQKKPATFSPATSFHQKTEVFGTNSAQNHSLARALLPVARRLTLELEPLHQALRELPFLVRTNRSGFFREIFPCRPLVHDPLNFSREAQTTPRAIYRLLDPFAGRPVVSSIRKEFSPGSEAEILPGRGHYTDVVHPVEHRRDYAQHPPSSAIIGYTPPEAWFTLAPGGFAFVTGGTNLALADRNFHLLPTPGFFPAPGATFPALVTTVDTTTISLAPPPFHLHFSTDLHPATRRVLFPVVKGTVIRQVECQPTKRFTFDCQPKRATIHPEIRFAVPEAVLKKRSYFQPPILPDRPEVNFLPPQALQVLFDNLLERCRRHFLYFPPPYRRSGALPWKMANRSLSRFSFVPQPTFPEEYRDHRRQRTMVREIFPRVSLPIQDYHLQGLFDALQRAKNSAHSAARGENTHG